MQTAYIYIWLGGERERERDSKIFAYWSVSVYRKAEKGIT